MATDDKEPAGYVRANLKQRATALNVDPVVAEALECFECSAEMTEATRKAIIAAKNFRAGNQWPEQVREQRQGSPAIQGLAAQPARPCLTIDRVSGPTRQVSNMVRDSSFTITVLPVGDGADQDLADIFSGWIRRVQNESRGDEPVEWAADSAAEGGLGWFRISTYYTDVDPAFPFDQDLRLERIPNCLSVYPDPYAKRPTRSDMRWCLITEDLAVEEFKRQFPKADMASLDSFRATGDTGGWITTDGVRIAEYWRVVFDEVTLVELADGRSFKDSEKPSGVDAKRTRKRFDPRVEWYKITACEVLDKTDWAGTRIPLIPIVGEELNVDGKVVLRGVIGPAMDAQRMLNYSYSAAIESAALAPKAPWLVAEGQIDQYKAIWQTANTQNHSFLPYTPVALLGKPVGPPQRNTAEQPIQAFVQLMQASEEAIKFTTNTFDPSLGNSNPRERSGSAIEALQSKADFTQSNYQDNVMRAMTYAGELMVELGPKILDRPGRVIQILQLDDSPQHVMLGQPFSTVNQNGGPPQPLQAPPQPGQPPQPITDANHPMAQTAIAQGLAKFYDPTAGKFGVTVTVGKDHATRRQEESAALGDLIPHLPPPMQAALAPEYIETLDFSDSKKIADMARKALPPDLQAALAPDNPMADLPPQVKAQLAQVPMLQQALQQAKQIIDTEQVKANYQLSKEKLVGTKELLLAHVNNAAKILVAHITAAKEPGNPQDEGALERQATAIQQAHDAYQASLDRMHEFNMAQLEHQQTMQQAEQAHQHATAQTAQAAALQPEPEPEPAGAGA